MAASPTENPSAGRTTLPEVLRAIRRRRGLSSADVAREMGIALRTYQHFESGRGRLKVARVHQFARAVNADAYAILFALEINSTAFALRCMDNKLMTILVMGVQDFDATAQDDLVRLDPHTLMSTFNRAFDELAVRAREADAHLERWMSDRSLHGPPEPEPDADPPEPRAAKDPDVED